MASDRQADIENLDPGLRRFLEQLWREDAAAGWAFTKLIDAGCHPEVLAWFLAGLSATVNPRVTEQITRKEFDRAIRDIEVAANKIKRVAWTQAAPLFDSEGDWLRLHLDVLAYAERMKRSAAQVSKRNKVTERKWFAKFQDYVQRSTKQPHDDDVSSLASAALGRSVDRPVAARQRRARRSGPQA